MTTTSFRNRQNQENSNLENKRSSHVRQLGSFYFQKPFKSIVVRPLPLSPPPSPSFELSYIDRLSDGEVVTVLFGCF